MLPRSPSFVRDQQCCRLSALPSRTHEVVVVSSTKTFILGRHGKARARISILKVEPAFKFASDLCTCCSYDIGVGNGKHFFGMHGMVDMFTSPCTGILYVYSISSNQIKSKVLLYHLPRSHKNSETQHSVCFFVMFGLFMKLITLAPQSTIDILARVP